MKLQCVNCQVKGVQKRLNVPEGATHELGDPPKELLIKGLGKPEFVPYSVNEDNTFVHSHWRAKGKGEVPDTDKPVGKDGKQPTKTIETNNVAPALCPDCGSPTLEVVK